MPVGRQRHNPARDRMQDSMAFPYLGIAGDHETYNHPAMQFPHTPNRLIHFTQGTPWSPAKCKPRNMCQAFLGARSLLP